MRVLGLVVLCAWAASAQTSVAGRGTVGLSAEREGAAAVSAVEVLLERSFQSSLSVSAHLVALVLATPGSLNFQDLGSSVRVQLRLADWDTEALFLELFPFDSRRVRPAFDFANQWDRPTRPTTVAPVLRLGFARHNTSVWAALRGHQQLDNRTLETGLKWTGMFGGGVLLPAGFASDLILTVADRGDIPALALMGVETLVLAAGGSARLAWQSGGGVGAALDPASYGSDPDRFARLFAAERYEVPSAAYVGLEGGVASQNLEDPDVFAQTRRTVTGFADLQARVRLGGVRLFATARFHEAGFINFAQPGIPPYRNFPAAAVTQDEVSLLLGADYRIVGLGLTPGVLVRLIRPSTVTGLRMLGGNNPAGAIGTRVGVMRKDGTLSILPSGAQAQVELQATASLLFNRFDLLSALLLIHYGRDPNTSDFRDAVSGATEPTRALAQTWRVELLAQLRF